MPDDDAPTRQDLANKPPFVERFLEGDFIIGDHPAVETKAKESLSGQDLKFLCAIAEEKKLKRYLCVCLEARPRRIDNVPVLPLRQFLNSLWGGEYS